MLILIMHTLVKSKCYIVYKHKIYVVSAKTFLAITKNPLPKIILFGHLIRFSQLNWRNSKEKNYDL